MLTSKTFLRKTKRGNVLKVGEYFINPAILNRVIEATIQRKSFDPRGYLFFMITFFRRLFANIIWEMTSGAAPRFAKNAPFWGKKRRRHYWTTSLLARWAKRTKTLITWLWILMLCCIRYVYWARDRINLRAIILLSNWWYSPFQSSQFESCIEIIE